MGNWFSSKFLPGSVDLRPYCPPIYDQEHEPTCTANALSGLYATLCNIHQHSPGFIPSRLFIYYNEEIFDNPTTGIHLIEGVNSLETFGVCSEKNWPYQIDKISVQPPYPCYVEAYQYVIQSSESVPQELIEIKNLLNNKIPFVFGFAVYSNFHDSNFKEGVMKMPEIGSKVLGHHAIVCVGYDDQLRAVLCRNSWGESWGRDGYFYMPYEFILNPNYCEEFWRIRI